MLRLYARLRGVPPAIQEQAIEQLLTRIGLQQYSDRWAQSPCRQIVVLHPVADARSSEVPS